MRRSTLLTRVLGTGSLVASAVALVLVFARYNAPSPRLDMVAAVAAALVLAGAWALACRVSPPLAGLPAGAPTGGMATIPAALPAPFRDPGRTAGAVLLALTPVTLARLAGGTEPTALEGVGILLVLVVTLKVVGPLRKATSQKDERERLKVLIEDAAAGEVYGLRVRAGRPAYVRYSERGDKPGSVSVSHFTTYAFQPLQGGEEIPLGTARSELTRAGVLLGGEEGWLIWPKRWKLIEGALPMGFVADRGGVALLGVTPPGPLPAGAALYPTTPRRKARALPRNAKFRPSVHLPILGGGVLATLLCLPVLLVAKSSMPGPLAWLLCALAVAALLTGVTRGTSAMLDALLRDTEWTVEDQSDPSIA